MATLSPARIRIKFLRILPETWAKTRCLFSNSTRNIALGNGSITVAMTSMASSFGLPESPFFLSSSCGLGISSKSYCALPGRAGCIFWPRQNPGTVGGYSDRVLEVSGRFAVGRFSNPFVAHVNVRLAGVHHRLDGDDHAFLKPRAATRITIVRKVGLVMHLGADAVPDKLTNYRVPVLLDPSLHRVTDIAQPIARAHFVDRAIQRLSSHFQQLFGFRSDLSNRHSHRRISEVSVHFHPEVDRDDVALAKFPLGRRNPVNDLAVHRSAERAGITAISLERRPSGLATDLLLSKLLEVHRRQTRPNNPAERLQDLVNNETCAVHLFQLFRTAQMNRHFRSLSPASPDENLSAASDRGGYDVADRAHHVGYAF